MVTIQMVILEALRCLPETAFNLSRTATNCTIKVEKDGVEVADGTNKVETGDELVITFTAEEGYVMSVNTVNGETFVSGETFTVGSSDVTIVGTAVSE